MGSRKNSPELAEESKLSQKESVEYLRSGWVFEDENTVLADIFSRLIKMYSFKEDTVLDLFSMNKVVQDVAEKLGRRGLGDEKSEPAETIREYIARQQDELEANQPVKSKNEPEEDDWDYEALAFGLGSTARMMEHA
jgi:hypothetical protein